MTSSPITLCLGGDVMTGRGIDQVLPHPGPPHLFEPYVRSAEEYVAMAEAAHGKIGTPVAHPYIWGDTLEEMARVKPDVRIVNLETSITTSDGACPEKAIHYRMHPANIGCLTAAALDCCVLANNHVLDWGTAGLEETLDSLQRAGIATAGAGPNRAGAAEPATLPAGAQGRVLLFALGSESSGIPRDWEATERRPGVNLLRDLSDRTFRQLAEQVARHRRPGDVVVASIHWGPNWGYEVPPEQRAFAHRLIDEAGMDVVHGHSSHHPKGIEVHRGRPILYGCGDLLNDYEGIPGYEPFRDDLALLYFADLDRSDGRLVRFRMSPFQIRRFRLHRASSEDTSWLERQLSREGKALGTRAERTADDTLTLHWA